MEITRIPIESLHCDPANVRKHDKKNLSAIAGSLKSFGQQKPIVVDGNNVVIAGNGTLEAAKSLGWHEIDCVRTEMTGAEAIAFALADNRTAELAFWDMDELQLQLGALFTDEFDIGEIGFNPSDFGFTEKKSKDSNKEFSADDFSDFEHTCPKCGFQFNDK